MKRGLALLFAAALLASGCSLFKSKDNIHPPKPVPKFAPTLTVKELWSHGIGDGAGRSGVRLRPVVSAGIVYAASDNGSLAAWKLDSGATVWSHAFGGGWHPFGWFKGGRGQDRFTGGPSVADGLLVVGTQKGGVYAFEAKTGKELWRAQVSSEVISAPAIAGGRVFVRTNDGHVFALDGQTGKQDWLYDRGDVPALSLRGNGTLLAVNGALFFGADDGKLVALSQADGSTLWQLPIATGEGRTDIQRLNDADGRVTFANGTLYVDAYHGNVMAVDPATGHALWSRPLSSYTGVDEGAGKVVVVDDTSAIWALDASNGGDLWKQDVLGWRWLSAPAIQMDKYIVVGDLQGYAYWLAIADGKLLAKEHPAGSAIAARPLVVGDVVVLAGDDGSVTAYRVSGG